VEIVSARELVIFLFLWIFRRIINMGQKIHPTAFRLSIARNWNSRWYASAKKFPVMLAEDLKVREFLKIRLKGAAVSRILIERPAKNAKITIYSARPGVVIGKKGEDIEGLKVELTKLLGVPVSVNIEEIRKPEIGAQLVADSITQQLEKRIMFRRAMKRAMQNAMRLGAKGIKIMSSGRLNGIEIARQEWYREGRVPLHTLKADIDYGFSEARTAYGVIGVKCWIYKGDRDQQHSSKHQSEADFESNDTDEARRGRRRGSSRSGLLVASSAISSGPAQEGVPSVSQPKRVRKVPSVSTEGLDKNKGI
jgi:small subunit ribosomal protein S3